MSLIVYFDGQYWVGIIEFQDEERLQVYRHVFGSEPKDAEILGFIHKLLPKVLSHSQQKGIKIETSNTIKRINPKRRQRQIAKEVKQKGTSTKSQLAMQAALDETKQLRRQSRSAQKRAKAQRTYELRVAKAKEKR